MRRGADRLAQEFQFLLNQRPDHPRLTRHQLRHPKRAGMLAMSRAKRIVYINLAELGQLPAKIRLVLLLFLVKAKVLQQQHVAVL